MRSGFSVAPRANESSKDTEPNFGEMNKQRKQKICIAKIKNFFYKRTGKKQTRYFRERCTSMTMRLRGDNIANQNRIVLAVAKSNIK